jgi:hypothetical protein
MPLFLSVSPEPLALILLASTTSTVVAETPLSESVIQKLHDKVGMSAKVTPHTSTMEKKAATKGLFARVG